MRVTKASAKKTVIYEVREGFKDLRSANKLGYHTLAHQSYGRVSSGLRVMFFMGLLTEKQHEALVGVAIDTLYC